MTTWIRQCLLLGSIGLLLGGVAVASYSSERSSAPPAGVAESGDAEAAEGAAAEGPAAEGPAAESPAAQADAAAAEKSVSLFDGTTLDGWIGDAPYWSVRDGAILGQITEETRIDANRFLIYQGDIPDDFEFVAEYRISAGGNSGINYRSEELANVAFHALRGYQFDLDGRNRYPGSNYEERKRTTLASIGQSVVIPEVEGAGDLRFVQGNRWSVGNIVSELPGAIELARNLLPDQWHEARIVARGNLLEHYIDGQLMSRVVDEDTANRRSQGRLGVQVHVGPPMTIEYRNLRVKEL